MVASLFLTVAVFLVVLHVRTAVSLLDCRWDAAPMSSPRLGWGWRKRIHSAVTVSTNVPKALGHDGGTLPSTSMTCSVSNAAGTHTRVEGSALTTRPSMSAFVVKLDWAHPSDEYTRIGGGGV